MPPEHQPCKLPQWRPALGGRNCEPLDYLIGFFPAHTPCHQGHKEPSAVNGATGGLDVFAHPVCIHKESVNYSGKPLTRYVARTDVSGRIILSTEECDMSSRPRAQHPQGNHRVAPQEPGQSANLSQVLGFSCAAWLMNLSARP